MNEPNVRILIPTQYGDRFAVIELPRRLVAMSLLNEAIDGEKTFTIEKAWANDDGAEITVRRIPARSP